MLRYLLTKCEAAKPRENTHVAGVIAPGESPREAACSHFSIHDRNQQSSLWMSKLLCLQERSSKYQTASHFVMAVLLCTAQSGTRASASSCALHHLSPQFTWQQCEVGKRTFCRRQWPFMYYRDNIWPSGAQQNKSDCSVALCQRILFISLWKGEYRLFFSNSVPP